MQLQNWWIIQGIDLKELNYILKPRFVFCCFLLEMLKLHTFKLIVWKIKIYLEDGIVVF